MKLRIPRTNIEHQLLKVRNKSLSEEKILDEIALIFRETEEKDKQVIKEIENGTQVEKNDFNPEVIDTDRIFHLNQIYRICIEYRLRFLESKYFKGEIPYEALIRIKELESQHNTSLKGFRIVAPSSLFKLENADDPLLFAPIGNDYYYLIHKWGNDLHPFRKLIMWPFRTLENFVLLLIVASFLTALLVPDGLFSPEHSTTEFFIVFFFIFKWFAGLAIFYGFKMGKNFNTEIWNSKYYNA
ncbi:hypothetical protein [Gramella sp. KN1008]|uniref:hypothetical protein n=1 Tax=Gramella sp. KN1008 TaxID=2529298 RepID=UPI00103EA83E|nr:hypothetical protein [Gramella sp. KN1008]TBW28401.1 hypothetical protein EZJ28_06595 [Gramella sp. KN1008]